MKFLRAIVVFLVVFLSSVLMAAAQEESADQAGPVSSEDWQKTIDHVKAETSSLLTDNEKLNSEYEFLQQKVAGLKAELEKSRAEVKDLKKAKKPSVTDDNGSARSPAEMEKMQKDVDAAEAENKNLQKQLADIQEKNRLWKIQASQMENQKRDANLDLNYQKAQGEVAKKTDKDSADLQAQLEKSLQEEKDLNVAISKLGAQNDKLPKETVALKKKNRDLEIRVDQLKKQIASQEKKNAQTQKLASKGEGSVPSVSSDLLKKKKELESEVAKLTAQLDGVNATVNQSKDVLGKKRQLMDQIMYLDAENQNLRAQIDDLLSDQEKSKAK